MQHIMKYREIYSAVMSLNVTRLFKEKFHTPAYLNAIHIVKFLSAVFH